MADLYDRARDCAAFVLGQTALRPRVGLILGSGLGAFADTIEGGVSIDYASIPGFVETTVQGHDGRLVIGRAEGVEVVVMAGRFHRYEGHDLDVVTFPVRVMRQMGVRYLFVTNSAGGINAAFDVGTLMIIDDHLNLFGGNPLTGENDERFGPRFPDMTEAYSAILRAELDAAAVDIGIEVAHGVYAGLAGPSYETPAEIRMLRVMGADAVGMSTVPEIIAANHGGMIAAGISCVSNKAAGMVADERLSHDHVKAAAQAVGDRFVALLRRVLSRMAASAAYDWSEPEWLSRG